MLTTTYFVVLCVCVACWRLWRRSVERISVGSSVRRGLVCSYWLFAFTILADLLASLSIQSDDLTRAQFRVLFLLAVGTMLQVALLALVATPVVMRGRFEAYPFTKAQLFMEGCAAISIVILALGLICLMHDQGSLLHGP
jgi:hypothetical protein